jgi:hypothetical protein
MGFSLASRLDYRRTAAGLSRNRCSTLSGTRPRTLPPSEKTSLMSRELM